MQKKNLEGNKMFEGTYEVLSETGTIIGSSILYGRDTFAYRKSLQDLLIEIDRIDTSLKSAEEVNFMALGTKRAQGRICLLPLELGFEVNKRRIASSVELGIREFDHRTMMARNEFNRCYGQLLLGTIQSPVAYLDDFYGFVYKGKIIQVNGKRKVVSDIGIDMQKTGGGVRCTYKPIFK